MFSLRMFILSGLKDAVGQLADYRIILNATGWYEKGVLQEEDLAQLQTLIDEKNISVADKSQENTDGEATAESEGA